MREPAECSLGRSERVRVVGPKLRGDRLEIEIEIADTVLIEGK
jgi:hypothetical protein